MTRTDWKHDAVLLFVVLVWGVNFPVVKAVLAVMHPFALNAFRFVISASVLGFVYAYRARRSGQAFFEPLRTHPWLIAGLGLLNFFFYQVAFIVGVDHTTAGNAALIMATGPLWTAVFAALLRLESLSRGAWLSLLVVFGGAAVVVLGGSKALDLDSTLFVGNLIMLAAALLSGSNTALSRPVLRTVTPTALSFLSLLFSLPLLFGLAVPHMDEIAWDRVTGWTWAAILFSGGLSTGLAVPLWNVGIQRVGASHTAVFGNLVPLAALLSSLLLLGEPITLVQLVGGALIIGGIVWMRRSRSVVSVPKRLAE